MFNKNKSNKINKLARSGNPAKRSQVPEAKAAKVRATARERFLRVTGLVVIAALSATLLVGVFSNF
jgi:hypothetical protein